MPPRFRRVAGVLLVLAFACAKEQSVERAAKETAVTASMPAAPSAPTARRAPEPAAALPAPPTHPNFLVITLDTVRFDVTGADPRSSNGTPFMNELAKSGVNFVRSYSTFDATPESHFSILTGFVSGWSVLPLDVKEFSLPFQLRKVGYRTFGIAANGNLGPIAFRQAASFQNYTCLLDAWEALPAAQKNAKLKSIDKLLDRYGAPHSDFNRLMVYSSAEEVLTRLRKRLDSGTGPFFGFLNFIDAHDPYLPDPHRYDAKSVEESLNLKGFESDLRARDLGAELKAPEAIEDAKRREFVAVKIRDASGRAWSTTLDLSKDELRAYRMRYRAEVRELDQTLRDVWAILRERKLLDSTIVVITSDHGEAFGEKDMITHSFGNRGDREATHRVPLMMILPPSYGVAGVAPEVETSGADIAPTLYELAGFDWSAISHQALPGNFGKSLVPYFAGVGRFEPGHRISIDSKPNVTPEEMAKSRSEAEKRLRSLGYIR